MANPFTRKRWSPYLAGAGVGVLSWFAFASADQPLGITAAFEHTAALAARAAFPGFGRTNVYYADQAAQGNPPRIGWEWMLVAGVFLGALLSSRLSGDRTRRPVPGLWYERFGRSVPGRLRAAFLGGVLMMFGARLAGGCTTGHGLSGTLQLALSGWAFLLLASAAGVVTALLIYGKEGAHHG